ncbi:tRNA (adenosine(37)-N6)-threonylcarbamoyltransferase complex ATPase subunit type 1 TsaE [Patescibacteria group bacterium]
MKLKFVTNNSFQTKKMGEALAKEVLKTAPKKKAFVIGLKGDLGGGKTTFLQGFAMGLGIKQKILSPTFVLMKKFEIKKKPFQFFYHFDCYRIQKPKEILILGFKEIISNSKNIVVIEWADRLRKILPQKSLILKFEFLDKNKRKIVLE